MNKETPDLQAPGRLRVEDRGGLAGQDTHLQETENTLNPEQTALELEEGWETHSNHIVGRAIMATLSGVIFLILGAWLIYSIITPPTPSPKEASTPPATASLPAPSFLETATTAEITAAVESCLKSFMNAQDNFQRCQTVKGGRKQLPKMNKFYARFSPESLPSGFGRVLQKDWAAFKGQNIINVLALDASAKHILPFTLVSDQDGLKIDWETSFCYGEYHWTTFLKKKPPTPTQMRVRLQRLPDEDLSGYDSDHYEVFQISMPNEEVRITTLVLKDSPLQQELTKKAPGLLIHPMNLSLYWPDPEKDVKISSIIHKFWSDPKPLKNDD